MEPQVLYHIPSPYLVDIAEHLFSLLLGSYVWMGGLNAVVGGKQTTSKIHVPPAVWEAWEKKIRWKVSVHTSCLAIR